MQHGVYQGYSGFTTALHTGASQAPSHPRDAAHCALFEADVVRGTELTVATSKTSNWPSRIYVSEGPGTEPWGPGSPPTDLAVASYSFGMV